MSEGGSLLTQLTEIKEAKLQELRDELSQLSACLPKSIDLAALSRFKAPGKVLMLRESLIWRAEELGRKPFRHLMLATSLLRR